MLWVYSYDAAGCVGCDVVFGGTCGENRGIRWLAFCVISVCCLTNYYARQRGEPLSLAFLQHSCHPLYSLAISHDGHSCGILALNIVVITPSTT